MVIIIKVAKQYLSIDNMYSYWLFITRSLRSKVNLCRIVDTKGIIYIFIVQLILMIAWEGLGNAIYTKENKIIKKLKNNVIIIFDQSWF